MYDGMTAHRAPTPMPCIIRPAESIQTDVGNTSMAQPTNRNPSNSIMLAGRPNTLDTYPAGSAPRAAPMPNTELNICASFPVTSNGNNESSASNMFWAGDDHPSMEPVAIAPSAAETVRKRREWQCQTKRRFTVSREKQIDWLTYTIMFLRLWPRGLTPTPNVAFSH